MTLKNLMIALSIIAAMFVVGCEEEAEETTTDPETNTEPGADDENVEPAADDTPEPAPAADEQAGGGGGGGSACDRAQSCCEAYVQEMTAMAPGTVTTEQACAGIAGARAAGAQGDATCNTLIASWRQSLTQAQRTVPAACAE